MARQIGLAELTVLALLAERPMHPYEMQRLIRQRRKDYISGSARSLYRAVDRLARGGHIQVVETSREGNRPERTVYRITDEGLEQFTDQLQDLLAVPTESRPEFTAAIAFLGHAQPAAAIQALQARAASLEGQVAGQRARLQALTGVLDRVLLLEEEYLIAVRVAELAWIQELVSDISDRQLHWNPGQVRANPDSLVRSPPTADSGERPGPSPKVKPMRAMDAWTSPQSHD